MMLVYFFIIGVCLGFVVGFSLKELIKMGLSDKRDITSEGMKYGDLTGLKTKMDKFLKDNPDTEMSNIMDDWRRSYYNMRDGRP